MAAAVQSYYNGPVIEKSYQLGAENLVVKRKLSLLLLFGIVALAASGCGGSNDGNAATASPGTASVSPTPSGGAGASAETQSRIVTDEAEHQVEIPADPQRIWAPYLEDPLTVLGVKPVAQWTRGDNVISYLKEQLDGLPKIDFGAGGLDPENISSHNPDLILLFASFLGNDGAYEQYAKIAPTYSFAMSGTDGLKTLRTLGELLNKSDIAEQAIADYEAKAADAKERLHAAIGDKPVALVDVAGKTFSLLGDQYYGGKVLYRDLGLTPTRLVKDAGGEARDELSLEKIPELDDAYAIFMITEEEGEIFAKEMTDSKLWQSLPAVQQNRVFQADYDYWINSGLIATGRVVDEALEQLSR